MTSANRTFTLTPLATTLALAFTWSASVAQAQTSATAPEASATTTATASQAVTVVGTRAKGRTVFDSAVPVDRYSARDIEQAVAATGEVGSALQLLSPSINQPRVSASGAADSVRVVQLRGLAPDQVLVLVNGKRRHTNAVLDLEGIFQGSLPVDLNTLPASAIERIEVLRDGAGAQYGSDAIAGVINIVLKGGGTGGSASINVGANHTRFAPTGRTLTDGQSVQVAADQGITLANGGTVRFGAEALRKAGTNRAGASDAGWTSWNSTAADLALDGQVLFKSGDPAQRSANLFYTAEFPLDDVFSGYSFATLQRRNTEGAAFFRYPGDPNNVEAVYPNGYRPVTEGVVTDTAWVGGVRFLMGEWDADASLRLAQNRFNYGVSNSINASLGAASPTEFHLANFRAGQISMNLDASHATKLPGTNMPLNLAAGTEFLQESYRSEAGDSASWAAGSITSAPPGAQAGPGLRPVDAVGLSRDVLSAYLDAELDLTPALRVGAAVRHANYSDAGNATTGKLSTRFSVTPDWLLRGSVSTNFRAPALAQTGFRFATLNFNATGTGLQNNALLPARDPLAAAFGATPLKPETSRQLSLGTAWRNNSGSSLSVDAYRIEVDDRIVRTSDLQSDAVSAYLAARRRGNIQSVAFLTNAVDTTTEGVDVTVGQATKLMGGNLQLNAALNLTRTTIDQVRNQPAALAAIDPTLNLLGSDALLRITRGTPKQKLVLTAEWQGEAWAWSFRATHYGEVWAYSFDDQATQIDGAPAQALGDTWVVDAEVSRKMGSGWTVAVGANNLFNRYPTRTLNGSTYGGAFPYNFTDPTGLNGAYWYARANLRW
ncbi:TonB-dependent receptor plug domain-containing protein [Ideonella margarita]|uniref:TonB-dependent receptor n=1 Tax=Ideonella margarita TaxID=2984191 RepID=A0ABU9C412_9BURK